MSAIGAFLGLFAVVFLLLALLFDSTFSGVAIVFAIFALMEMLNEQHKERAAQHKEVLVNWQALHGAQLSQVREDDGD